MTMETQKGSSRIISDKRENWIVHKGKRILFHDYSGLRADEATQTVINLTDCIVNRGVDNLLFLVDVTGTLSNPKTITTFKKEAARSQPFTKKTAVIGVGGIVKFFLTVVNRAANTSAVAFDSKSEALDWLVED